MRKFKKLKKQKSEINILPLFNTKFKKNIKIICNLTKIYGLNIFLCKKILRSCKITPFSKNSFLLKKEKFNKNLKDFILNNFLVDSNLQRFIKLSKQKNTDLKNYKNLIYKLKYLKNL